MMFVRMFLLDRILLFDYDFVFEDGDREVIAIVKDKFSHDLSAAHPNNIQVIPKRSLDMNFFFDWIFQCRIWLLERVVLQGNISLCLRFVEDRNVGRWHGWRQGSV